MKKFIFSLEKMLGFKRSMYEKERNALAQLRAQRQTLEQRRNDTEAQMLAKDAEFREKAAVGVTFEEIGKINFHRKNSDKLIEQLDADIAELDVRIEAQLQIVIQLDKDVKGLEKLREKQYEEYLAESMKEEQERISEIVSTKYIEDQREDAAS